MKTETQNAILQLIREHTSLRPTDIGRLLGLSQVAVHYHLKKLQTAQKIRRVGQPPMVFYIAVDELLSSPDSKLAENMVPYQTNTRQLPPELATIIEKNYLSITPSGEMLFGLQGFETWAAQTGQNAHLEKLAEEYAQTLQATKPFFDPHGQYINATQKVHQTFPHLFLDALLYQDFYALPKFGKTKLGQLVLHAKQAQNAKIIQSLAEEARPAIKSILQDFQIDAVSYIPHSLPRTLPFLKELKCQLSLPLAEIRIVKAYSGEIPIAQKSLGKLEERIQNARETIFIRDSSVPYKRVLLIDDAVGSGATLNETAQKLKQQHNVEFVVGFALVGSWEGFEVIREV